MPDNLKIKIIKKIYGMINKSGTYDLILGFEKQKQQQQTASDAEGEKTLLLKPFHVVSI